MKNTIFVMLFLLMTSFFNPVNSMSTMQHPMTSPEMSTMAMTTSDCHENSSSIKVIESTMMDCEDCNNCAMNCFNVSNIVLPETINAASYQKNDNTFNPAIKNFVKTDYKSNLFRPPIV